MKVKLFTLLLVSLACIQALNLTGLRIETFKTEESVNFARITLNFDDNGIINNISMSFDPPSEIPTIPFTDFTNFIKTTAFGSTSWDGVFYFGNYGTNMFVGVKSVKVNTTQGIYTFDTFPMDSFTIANGFAIQYVPDRNPPVLYNVSLNTTILDLTKGETALLTVFASDFGGYNGIKLYNAFLSSPINGYPDIKLGCLQDSSNSKYPIRNLTCLIDAGLYSFAFVTGNYSLSFELFDGVFYDNIYTADRLALLGFPNTVQIKAKDMPNIVSITYDQSFMDVRRSSSSINITVSLDMEGDYVIDLRYESKDGHFISVSVPVSNYTGTTVYTQAPFQLTNGVYQLTKVVISIQYGAVKILQGDYLTYESSIAVLSSLDKQAPYLDMDFFNHMAAQVEPSKLEGLGGIINVTFRVFDFQSGFRNGIITFNNDFRFAIPFGENNRIQGDIYNGTYSVLVTVNFDTQNRYCPTLELYDNLDNMINYGATGCVDTNLYNATTRDNQWTDTLYYITSTPFDNTFYNSEGDIRIFALFLPVKSQVQVTFSSANSSVYGQFLPSGQLTIGKIEDTFPALSYVFFQIAQPSAQEYFHLTVNVFPDNCTQVCLYGNVNAQCKCDCNTYYDGEFCEREAVCSCEERGKCISDGVCQCLPRFSGPNCTDCAEGLYGADCRVKCPVCNNQGTCNTASGKCDCPANTVGYLCESCAPGYYTDSSPCNSTRPEVLYLAPSFGIAGSEVIVTGVFFNSDNVQIFFGNQWINGTTISDTEILFTTPDMTGSQSVTVYIDSVQVTSPALSFKFIGNTCGTCYGGVCFLGICVCYENFTGNFCETPRQLPSIVGSSNDYATEGQDFSSSEMTVYNSPDSIQLIDFPQEFSSEISLQSIHDAITKSYLLWSDTAYGSYNFQIKASNKYGDGFFNKTVDVQAGYTVSSFQIVNGPLLFVKDIIKLTGTLSNEAALKSVNIKVLNKNKSRVFQVMSDTLGRFSLNYTTGNVDIGTVTFLAYSHDEDTVLIQSVFVSGFRVDPAESLIPTLTFYLGENQAKSSFYLNNVGNSFITGISSHVSILGNVPSTLQSVSISAPSSLGVSETGAVYVTVNATGFVSATQVQASFMSLQNVTVRVNFTIEVRPKEALLVVTGNNQEIKQDGQSFVLITVTNIGGSPSGVLTVIFPISSSSISMVSPTTIPSLLPGQSYTLTLMVTPSAIKREADSDVTSQIIIYSDSTAISSTIRLTPKTTITPNVTIQVEDELGLLSGATVTVTFNGTVQSQETVEGMAIFILEDLGQVDIQVEAENHSPARQSYSISQSQVITILVSTTPKTEYTVQYNPSSGSQGNLVAVATTEARIPLVTVTPSTVSITDAIVNSQSALLTFTFSLANAGAVKAENVRVTMPQIDKVSFTLTPQVIGDIEPGQTVYFTAVIYSEIGAVAPSECVSAIISYSSTVDNVNVFNYTSSILFSSKDCVNGYSGRSIKNVDTSKVTVTVGYLETCLRDFNSLITGFPNFGCPACLQEKITGFDVENIATQVVSCMLTCDKTLPTNITKISSTLSQLLALRVQCQFQASQSDSYGSINRIYEYLTQLSIYMDLIDSVFGDISWKNVYRSPFWAEMFLNVTSANSENGTFISTSESAILVNNRPESLNNIVTATTVTKFITRWNLSYSKWQQSEFESIGAMSYSNLYSGYQNFLKAQSTAKALGSLNYGDGLQSTVQQLQLNLAKSFSGSAFMVGLQSSRSSVVAMDTFTLVCNISQVPTNISKLMIHLDMTDKYTNQNASDKLDILKFEVVGITGGIDGTGSIDSGNVAMVTWTIQPRNYTEDVAAIYNMGGYMSFVADGTVTRIPFYTISITVYPITLVHVDYFIPFIFKGDNPYTAEIEDASPTQFAMTVSNKAGGYLTDLTIASLTSTFVDSATGVTKVQYRLLDTQLYSLSNLSSQKVSPTFNLNMGDILGTQSSSVIWTLVPSASGKFAKFQTSHKHVDETGYSRSTTLVKIASHSLVKIVQIRGNSVLDFMPSFLVDDNRDGTPDTIYNGLGEVAGSIPAPVKTSPTVVSEGHWDIIGEPGITFISTTSPYGGNSTWTLISVTRKQITRSVDSTLSLTNFWQNGDTINIFDDQSTGSFSLVFTQLQYVQNLSVNLNETNRIGISWEAPLGATVYKLLYRKSTATSFLTISSTILDTFYIIGDLQSQTSYQFRVYAGNGNVFESTGSTIEVSTLASTVTCSSSMCKNNGTSVAIGGACFCVCDPDACNFYVAADCSCNQCISANGTSLNGPCDDGDDCTSGESCSNGVCGGGSNICQGDPCEGVVCATQDCYNVTCAINSMTNSPYCKSTPLAEGSTCSSGFCRQNECVAEVQKAVSKKSSNVGAIVGGVVGGVAALLIVGAVVAYVVWKRKQNRLKDKNIVELLPYN